ncbi:SA1362 family protein [Halalkalibacterium halodurans]|uniref:SA1362 family protein n=1 Tax=Halalkalibacterium halodurans TaxID=86665 RepID=UPI0010685BC5|nr:SA1362 family protein [Halalkalibacterium halodurans]MED4080208.1 SA1362 family protein [Halalkalibacterium halodurans]MED4084724.1 SA1362 family protein [Halalkalibacterium halodurans]MED4103896.1 SA1362 family protein [Halalkalibacterium halodurans]MED4109032.1 SA1362 family protein [Halalkalibacterium halodurans]MED4122563.1 SA1362 family protein [Halalkalibacterium halodurans]
MHRTFHPLVLLVIGLAIVGFVTMLFTNPLGLLRQLIMVAVIAAIIYFVFRWIVSRRYGSPVKGQGANRPTAAQIRKAKRTSTVQKQKEGKSFGMFSDRTPSSTKRKKSPALKRRDENPHLTVIEGKKNKKKNRALF